jgi:hypothetical protein
VGTVCSPYGMSVWDASCVLADLSAACCTLYLCVSKPLLTDAHMNCPIFYRCTPARILGRELHGLAVSLWVLVILMCSVVDRNTLGVVIWVSRGTHTSCWYGCGVGQGQTLWAVGAAWCVSAQHIGI